MVLPNINSFGSTVAVLGSANLTSLMGRFTSANGPLLNVYLNVRLLFRDDRRGNVARNLGLLPNRIEHFPNTATRNRACGIPRVN